MLQTSLQGNGLERPTSASFEEKFRTLVRFRSGFAISVLNDFVWGHQVYIKFVYFHFSVHPE